MMFEEAISRIDNEICVQKEDRESYCKDYDAIRYYLMDIMQQTDPVFKQIYSGTSLFGSYLENLKTGSPDEFDVHFLLKLPFYEQIKVEKDPQRPGYVKLLISEPLKLMENDPNLKFVYILFKQFVSRGKYLTRTAINRWLEKIINEALTNYGNILPNAAGTDEYELIYLKRGTAHTFKARSKSRNISIDFVPALRFNADYDWLAERPFPKNIKEKLWFAVPKPSVGPKGGRKLTFSICVPQPEKQLLIGKNNLKPTLRLLKAIRDKTDHRCSIKSYFIKSIYLHENDNQNEDYWMQPTGKLLLQMLDKLILHLHHKSLNFYWCPSMNLLESLKYNDVLELKEKFQSVRNSLEIFSHKKVVDYDEIRTLLDPSIKPKKNRGKKAKRTHLFCAPDIL